MMKTHNFLLANCDTDSISFCKSDHSLFTEEEQINLLMDLNSNYPKQISWEHDGIYQVVCILKAKNYILLQDGKIKKKGSSLKSSKIEKGLSDLMSQVIDCLIYDKQDQLVNIYNTFIKEVHNVKDISRWTSKKTVTASVLKPTRTNEQKQLDALKGINVSMGDKFYVYFTTDGPLKVQEQWTADHSVEHLIKKIYKTLLIFKNVIDIEQFPKYHLKNKLIKAKLQELLNV